MSAVHATIPGRNAPWHSHGPVDGRPLVPVGAKKPTYRPRDPRNTPLYRLLVDHLETFLAVYEDRYEHRFGPLGTHVERQIEAYRECGLFSAGCARGRCPDCGHEFLLPLECRSYCTWSVRPLRVHPACHEQAVARERPHHIQSRGGDLGHPKHLYRYATEGRGNGRWDQEAATWEGSGGWDTFSRVTGVAVDPDLAEVPIRGVDDQRRISAGPSPTAVSSTATTSACTSVLVRTVSPA